MTAHNMMEAKIKSLSDEKILESLRIIDGPWDTRTPEQHTVRAALLGEYETRHGGEFIDTIMNSLEATMD